MSHPPPKPSNRRPQLFNLMSAISTVPSSGRMQRPSSSKSHNIPHLPPDDLRDLPPLDKSPSAPNLSPTHDPTGPPSETNIWRRLSTHRSENRRSRARTLLTKLSPVVPVAVPATVPMSFKHRILHANPNLATGPVIMISNAAAPEFREVRHVAFNLFTEGHEIKRLETAPARTSPSSSTKTKPLRYHGTGSRYARRASEPGSPGLDSATIDRLLGRKTTVENEFMAKTKAAVKSSQVKLSQKGSQKLVQIQTSKSVETFRTPKTPPPPLPPQSSHFLPSNSWAQNAQNTRNMDHHQNSLYLQNSQRPQHSQNQSHFDRLQSPPQSPTHAKQKLLLSLDTVVNTASSFAQLYPRSPRVSCHSFQSLIVPPNSTARPVSVETHSPLATVLNPKHFLYEPRGDVRVQRVAAHRTVIESFMVRDSPRKERAIELLEDDCERMKEMWVKANGVVEQMEAEGEKGDNLTVWRDNRDKFKEWVVIYQELIEDAHLQLEETKLSGIALDERRVDPIASPMFAVIEGIVRRKSDGMESEGPAGVV
ncbi:Protein of unknown function [Pyronema omphalodes CBS 100304]|uniref:Uncharacterized protein n=1 Tax=Pyronema omphalodes (strain CBS 100304) TaxID=1076935 RepID=U4LDM6_PYROM|nr:Protein of unknown function [Pyronema omphalodes CBS 100304]